MTSDNEHWSKFDKLLDELFDLSPEARAITLDEIGSRDSALGKRAAAILEYASSNNTMPDNASSAAPELLAEFAEEDVKNHIGERVGPFRIAEAISRGGMGLVFRGERADGAFEQQVAIKLIPASIDGERSLALFERETQLLARLEHPNIARIIDAGVTEQDTPYFAMELVDGQKIDDYVLSSQLNQKSILHLFLHLCDALAYCHQSTVVHGDVKPGNVLVASGRVRLVDFGIGQLLEDVEGTEGTEVLKRVVAYSPGYAAPEQMDGKTPGVAADIYSSGVLLRHLIRVSMNITDIPTDLDAIINCCTAEHPGDRYASVDALKRDIQAFLDKYPVRARDATRAYRSRKFVERNKLLVGSTIGVLLSLVVGLSTALWQFQKAKTEGLRAEQTNAFLTTIFERANPVVAGESEVTLKEIVDDAATRVAIELEGSPDVRNEIKQLLGNAYYGIGQYDKAFELHQSTLEYWRSERKAPNLEIVKALNALGSDHTKRGEYVEAERLHREALNQLQDLEQSASTPAQISWTSLGHSLVQTDPGAARESMLKAHDINLRTRPADTAALARSLGNIAAGYRAERNIEESARYHEMALAMAETNGERLAPEIVGIRCNLALDYGTLGRHLKARETQLECNRQTVERLGADHPANVPNLNNLGALDLGLGRLEEAEQSYLQAWSLAEQKLPLKSLERMAVEINYAVVFWHSGRIADAENILRDVLQRMEASLGATHPASGRVRSLLGRVVLQRGDVGAAQRFIENSLEGLIPYWRSDALLWLAEVMLELDDLDAAKTFATESLTIRRDIPHYADWQIAEAQWVLSRAANDQMSHDAAVEIFSRDLPPEHFRRTASR